MWRKGNHLMSKIKISKLPLARREKVSPSNRFGGFDVFCFIILLMFALLIIFPFYYLFIVSITPQEIYANNSFILWTPEISFDSFYGEINLEWFWYHLYSLIWWHLISNVLHRYYWLRIK